MIGGCQIKSNQIKSNQIIFSGKNIIHIYYNDTKKEDNKQKREVGVKRYVLNSSNQIHYKDSFLYMASHSMYDSCVFFSFHKILHIWLENLGGFLIWKEMIDRFYLQNI